MFPCLSDHASGSSTHPIPEYNAAAEGGSMFGHVCVPEMPCSFPVPVPVRDETFDKDPLSLGPTLPQSVRTPGSSADYGLDFRGVEPPTFQSPLALLLTESIVGNASAPGNNDFERPEDVDPGDPEILFTESVGHESAREQCPSFPGGVPEIPDGSLT